jgi:hypothetical protein
MQEHKILFFLAVWQRPEITELCFMGLKRLMKRGNVKCMAVISEESMRPLCKKYGIDFIEHENLPLGRKKNALLNAIMKQDFDYAIELGSDDLIFDDVFEKYKPFMDAGEDLFGSNQMIFVDAIMGHCRHYTAQEEQYGRGWGLGRCFSRRALEATGGRVKVRALEAFMCEELVPEGTTSYINRVTAESLAKQGFAEILESDRTYYLWDDEINRMLDNNSNQRLEAKGFKYKAVETGAPFLVDMKSDENLWGYNPEIGEAYELEKLLAKMTKEERAMFFANQKKLRAKRVEHAA